MKKFYYLFLLAVLFACEPKTIETTISGNILNQDKDEIIVSNNLFDTNDTLKIEDGHFRGKISVNQPGIFYLKNGKYGLSLYLKPGNEVNLNMNISQLKEGKYDSIKFSGKGFEASELINTLKQIKPDADMRTLLSYPADTFNTIIQDNYGKVTKTIDDFIANLQPEQDFINKIRLIKKIEMAEKYMYYTIYHPRLAPNDTLQIPSEFEEYGKDIPLNKTDYYKELNTYKYFVLRSYDQIIENSLEDKKLDENSIEYANAHIDAISSLQTLQTIKDELSKNLLGSYSYQSDSVQEVYKSRYKEILKNNEYLDEFEKMVATIEALKPGVAAPKFTYNDINGNIVTSDDLKGKVIYIDVWATWCGPCKRELPFLKKLEEELHDKDIAFVSISVDNDKDAWMKMVKKKELKGYQLHAPDAWDSDIIKKYAIRGIPRFIMIDKEGKLIEANASRPSDEETKNKLIEASKS